MQISIETALPDGTHLPGLIRLTSAEDELRQRRRLEFVLVERQVLHRHRVGRSAHELYDRLRIAGRLENNKYPFQFGKHQIIITKARNKTFS